MHEQIEQDFPVFTSDGEVAVGSVSDVRRGLPDLLIYIENAGEFLVPKSSVAAVHSGKVIVNLERLGLHIRVRDAFANALNSEDRFYAAPAAGRDAIAR